MSRRHSLSSTGSGRSSSTMLSANPTPHHDLSTDALCHVDARFAPRHAKKTPTSFSVPNKKPSAYCFPNGEVFRPRSQPHKRQRPGKVPRAQSMTQVPLAAINSPHHPGYSSTPSSTTRLPRNNSFSSANTSFSSANTTFTSRDNLIKSIRLQRSDTYTNLAPESAAPPSALLPHHPPPPPSLTKSASVPRMQPTNILRIESSDSIVQMSHMSPSLQSLPEGSSMRYSSASVSSVEDHSPASSHSLSMRSNSNTPSTSIDGVEVTKESEPLCPLPEHKEPSLDLKRDPRPHLPHTVPASATVDTTLDSGYVDALDSIPSRTMASQSSASSGVWSEDGEVVSVVSSPQSTTDTDKQPPAHSPTTPQFASQFAAPPPPVPHMPLPPSPRSPNNPKFQSMLTSKASQVFEKDLSSDEVEQKIIDALQNDTTVPPRGDLAMYSKSMQSLVSFDTFDEPTPRETLPPQAPVTVPVPPAVPIANATPAAPPATPDTTKNAGHSKAQSVAVATPSASKTNMPRSRSSWGLSRSAKSQVTRSSSKSNLRSIFRKIFRKGSDDDVIAEEPQKSPSQPQPTVQSQSQPPQPQSQSQSQPRLRASVAESSLKPEPLTLTRLPSLEPQLSGMDDVLRDIDEYGTTKTRKTSKSASSRHDPFVFDDELTRDQIADQQARDGFNSLTTSDPSDASDADDSYVDENILALREEFATNHVDSLIDLGNIYSTHRVDGPLEVMVVHRDQLDQVFSKFDSTGPHRRRLGNLKYVQQLSDFNSVKMTVRKFEDTVTPVAPSSVTLGKPSSLKSKRSRSNPRRVMFANTIAVNETYSAEAYPRVNRSVTQYTLTNPTEISRIKQELNQYKCEEMLVHELSQEHTHFFYP